MAGRLTGCLQVDRLPADEPGRTGRVPDHLKHAQLPRDELRIVADRLPGEQGERLRLQAVAGQDCDAVAVDDVQRRPSAAQRVVVHRGQIVVDERVGVNQFDRAGGRHGAIDRQARARHLTPGRRGAPCPAAARHSVGRCQLFRQLLEVLLAKMDDGVDDILKLQEGIQRFASMGTLLTMHMLLDAIREFPQGNVQSIEAIGLKWIEDQSRSYAEGLMNQEVIEATAKVVGSPALKLQFGRAFRRRLLGYN